MLTAWSNARVTAAAAGFLLKTDVPLTRSFFLIFTGKWMTCTKATNAGASHPFATENKR